MWLMFKLTPFQVSDNELVRIGALLEKRIFESGFPLNVGIYYPPRDFYTYYISPEAQTLVPELRSRYSAVECSEPDINSLLSLVSFKRS